MTLRSCLAALSSALLLILATPRTASADLTGFLGVTPTAVTRPAQGFAVGAGLLIVGFEFEYAHAGEDLTDPSNIAPELRTYMFNGLLQTPFAIAGIQPYATAGGGVYNQSVSAPVATSETSFGTNVGGGAKISLAGPVRLRVDYRVFNLRGSAAVHTIVQRFYAGINLKF
jgi:opacity protein-like surface antigen